jgi:two-component system osmolarity sensor histidine kinase EnvZ
VSCEIEAVPLRMLRPLAMQRLLDNLLVNAGRHAGGEILLRVRAKGEAVVLSVLDRGPGIPAELVEHLKQPFTRRDEARSGSSGAGLGLAIVNRVAALHGGRLELLPREGGGLEARVTLPPANPG